MRELWPIWRAAVRQANVAAALEGLYTRVGKRIVARGPTCWLSGRCCNFDAYGHRLYVTGLEIAWMAERLGKPQASVATPGAGPNAPARATVAGSDVVAGDLRLATLDSRLTATGPCPFQVGKQCGVHAIRPLGCRVFFCQDGTQTWQQDLYEEFLGDLRKLHDQLALPYRYMEWRQGLAAAL